MRWNVRSQLTCLVMLMSVLMAITGLNAYRIADIIGTIDEIAFQTNLLAWIA